MKRSSKFGRKSVSRYQIRVMLDYLGVPFAHQPKRVQEIKDMLEIFERNHNDKYEKAYSLIVDYEVPDGAPSSDVNAAELGKLVAEQIQTYEGLALKTVSDESKHTLEKLSKKYDSKIEDFSREAKVKADIAIQEAAKLYRPVRIEYSDGKAPVDLGEEVLHEKFPRIVQLGRAGKNILLVGPSGSGKTHIGSQLARALDLPFASQSCSQGVSEAQLTGWLLPIGDNGRFHHVPVELINLYEVGGVFLFDELDNSDPNVLVFINQMLANDSFYLPQRFDNPKVVRHKNFVAIGAANTYGTGANSLYNARQQLDAATLDRFRLGTINVDYSPAIETSLVDAEILNWGVKLREEIGKNSLKKIMSTRFLRDASDMKRDCGWGFEEIEEAYFADWSPEELRIVRHARAA